VNKIILLALLFLTSCATPQVKTTTIPVVPTPPTVTPLNLNKITFGTTGICLDAANQQFLFLNLNQINEHIDQQQIVIKFYEDYLNNLNK